MSANTKNPLAAVTAPPTPGAARQEAREHRHALFRGRAIIGLGLGLLVVFGLVTAAVLLLNPLTLDVPVTRAIQDLNFGPLNWLLLAVSAPGFTPWNFIFPTAIVIGLGLLRRPAEAAFLALAAVATLLDDLVKVLVHRARPSSDLVHVVQQLASYSFPSGHVAEYTLVFGFCFYLAFSLLKPGLLRTALLVLLAAMILLVGPSRIWMGQHWFSDVMGGYTLGCGLLLVVIWAYRGWEARRVTQDTTLAAQT
ncbi:MAG TPA: phosphatase PAP2 family protein [Chloroflexia bacterium]|nr:phosphatase PAP2 family protein [Chloroflexia bacterium]